MDNQKQEQLPKAKVMRNMLIVVLPSISIFFYYKNLIPELTGLYISQLISLLILTSILVIIILMTICILLLIQNKKLRKYIEENIGNVKMAFIK